MTNETPSRGLLVWAIAIAIFAAAALALNVRTLAAFDQPRPAPADAALLHSKILLFNDVDSFRAELDLATEALGDGRVYFPISDFDCPVTFLLPGALARRTLGCSPIAVMNGFALVAIFLDGVCAFGFLRTLGSETRFSIVLALAYEGSNFTAYSHHMGHMQYVLLAWVAAAFWACAGLCRPSAGRGWALFLGASMGLQMLTAPGITLYLALASLPAFCISHWWIQLRDRRATVRQATRFLFQVAVAAGIAGLLSSFYVYARLKHQPPTFPPPTWLPYTFSNYLQLLDPAHPTLFVGLPVFVLAVLGVNWWWWTRSAAATACLFSALAALLMMVPAVPGTPYWFMYQLIPPIRHTRVPTRFFPMFYISILGFIGQYLTSVTAQNSRQRWLVACGLLAALVAFDWLTSSWFYPIDPIPVLKELLGKKT